MRVRGGRVPNIGGPTAAARSTFGCDVPSGTSDVATRIGTAGSMTGALSAAPRVSGAWGKRFERMLGDELGAVADRDPALAPQRHLDVVPLAVTLAGQDLEPEGVARRRLARDARADGAEPGDRPEQRAAADAGEIVQPLGAHPPILFPVGQQPVASWRPSAACRSGSRRASRWPRRPSCRRHAAGPGSRCRRRRRSRRRRWSCAPRNRAGSRAAFERRERVHVGGAVSRTRRPASPAMRVRTAGPATIPNARRRRPPAAACRRRRSCAR